METLVSLRGVKKSFLSNRALDGFDLDIRRGKVIGLLGLNGAGKSTAMRVIAGLLKADEGTATTFGVDSWNMQPAERRRLGWLSEQDFPFPELDLKAAVAFVSRFHPTFDEALLNELVDMLEIPTRSAYRSMSRGQQRKFHLALTIAPRPELLLLDDPAQGLDVTVRREFIVSVLPLIAQGNSTVVFSSHVFSDIERLADTIVIVHRGRVLLNEDLDTLKERARQLIVPTSEALILKGMIRSTKSSGSTRISLLDAASTEIDELRRRFPGLQEHELGLEELFVELVSEPRRDAS
jgi:ABC-2 type transport system ATP-binding protein